MAARKRQPQSNVIPRIMTQRNTNRIVDAGIALGTLYVGAGVLGSIAGAFKK